MHTNTKMNAFIFLIECIQTYRPYVGVIESIPVLPYRKYSISLK